MVAKGINGSYGNQGQLRENKRAPNIMFKIRQHFFNLLFGTDTFSALLFRALKQGFAAK